MPSSVVKSFAKKTGKSEAEVEKLWSEAKKLAEEEGYKETDKNFYPIIVGILKKMLKLNEGSKMKTFKEFMNEKDEHINEGIAIPDDFEGHKELIKLFKTVKPVDYTNNGKVISLRLPFRGLVASDFDIIKSVTPKFEVGADKGNVILYLKNYHKIKELKKKINLIYGSR